LAIKPETEFVGKILAGNSNYPQGEARNITVPGDGTGTPWRARLINDIWGFLQRILSDASITPTGNPDTVPASQYKDALDAIFARLANANTFTAVQQVSAAGPPLVVNATSGVPSVKMCQNGTTLGYLGSNSVNKVTFYDSVGTPMVEFDMTNGKMNLGTVPIDSLDATASQAGYQQPGTGAEKIKILRGVINSDGTINSGSGFTVSHTLTGVYTITYSTAFLNAPAVVCTYTSNSVQKSIGHDSELVGSITVHTYNSSATLENNAFSFVAIGVPA